MRACRVVPLLLLAALVAFPAADADAQTRVVVSCTGVPLNDGANLLATYAAVPPASATNPYVVQAEPCLYDLGTSTLTLRSFVDLRGLGRNVTLITSSVDSVATGFGTLHAAVGTDVEIANLTVRNEEVDNAYAVSNLSQLFVLEDVILEATGRLDSVALYTEGRARGIDLVLRAAAVGEEVISSRAVGLEDVGGDSVITDTLVSVGSFGGPAGTDVLGIVLDGSDATLETVTVLALGGLNNTGIQISNLSQPTITNSRVRIDGNNGLTVGVLVDGDSNVVRLNDTRILAELGDSTTYGIFSNARSSVLLANVQSVARGGTTAIGLRAVDGLARVNRSTLEGDDNSLVVDAAATANVGVSHLIGARVITGTATCVGAYDGTFAAIGAGC